MELVAIFEIFGHVGVVVASADFAVVLKRNGGRLYTNLGGVFCVEVYISARGVATRSLGASSSTTVGGLISTPNCVMPDGDTILFQMRGGSRKYASSSSVFCILD